MLEITVILILMIIGFTAAAWYAHYRSKELRESLRLDDEPYQYLEQDSGFAAILDEEMYQQAQPQFYDVDDDPTVTLSSDPKIVYKPTTVQRETVTESQQAITDLTQPSLEFAESLPRGEWDMVVAFIVMAKQDRTFSGKSVKAILEKLDMHFGEMQLFHRYMPGGQKKVLFSVANVLDPGILLPDSFSTMSTPGLLVFAKLPGPLNGLLLFDEILDASKQIAATLDGTLCNENRKPLSQEAREAMRSKILNLNLSMQSDSDLYN